MILQNARNVIKIISIYNDTHSVSGNYRYVRETYLSIYYIVFRSPQIFSWQIVHDQWFASVEYYELLDNIIIVSYAHVSLQRIKLTELSSHARSSDLCEGFTNLPIGLPAALVASTLNHSGPGCLLFTMHRFVVTKTRK